MHYRLAVVCPGLGCFNSNSAVSGCSSSPEASMVRPLDQHMPLIRHLNAIGVLCRESKLSNMQRKLLGIPITPENADTPLRHRLTQPTQAKPAPQPMKSPLGAPNVSSTCQVATWKRSVAETHASPFKRCPAHAFMKHIDSS